MTTNQTIDGVPREQMISFPRELSDELAELIAEKARVCGGGADEIWEAICDQFGTQAQPHEPVAWLNVATGHVTTSAVVVMDWDDEKEQVQSLYAEQTAPVAVVIPERSNQDYAIEHAEYMALSADDVLAKFQAYGLALLAVDEGGDDGEGELLENIDSARGDLQESLVDLRSMVYEFRKRSAKS